MQINLNRILSGLVAAVYLATALYFESPEIAWKVGLFLIFPLACIWFSEAMGEFTGNSASVSITATTPGWMVLIGGWIVLLLPVIMAVLSWLMSKPG